MKTYFIRVRDCMNLYEQQYVDYTKKEAVNLYLAKYPQFKRTDLIISSHPYFNL